MLEKIEELKNQIGKPYQMFFEDGNYLGCFYPFYYLYPDAPKFKLPSEDLTNPKNFLYGIKCILKEFREIKQEEADAGDMIACECGGELHVALMTDKNNVIHVSRIHSLQVNKLRALGKRELRFFRKK